MSEFLGVNMPQPDQKGPSALDNAAKVLGIVTSLGNLGATGYNSLVTAPAQAAAAQTNADAMKALASRPSVQFPQNPAIPNPAQNLMYNPNNFNLGVKP